MKKITVLIVSLAFVFLSANPVPAKKYFKTYEVLEVTEKTITLKREGVSEIIEIDRPRRPYLKKGDRVRYDKNRNRLGKTLEKEE